MLEIISSICNGAFTKVAAYAGADAALSVENNEITRKKLWDVVGDIIMERETATVFRKPHTNCRNCLILCEDECDGDYYSKGMVDYLIQTQKETTYCIVNINNWRKEKMSQTIPMTFEDYENSLAAGEVGKELVSSASDGIAKSGSALSPFASGNEAKVSVQARNKTLDFAHPVDSTLVKALDNPSVNAVLSKIVQAGIDKQFGIALSTGIHITPSTSSELYKIIEGCADELGIAIPYVVISNSTKGLNASTCGTNQFAFVMVSSLLPMVMKKEELCFVIGHEFGHLAMGHAMYHTAGQLIGTAGSHLPVVGNFISNTVSYPLNAWSRRSEITADRAGLLCCKDLDAAKRALFRLEAGLYSAQGVDIDAYVAESEAMLANSHLGKISEINFSHPIIPKRIKALELFAKSEVYAKAMGLAVTDDMITKEQLDRETEHIIQVLDNPFSV